MFALTLCGCSCKLAVMITYLEQIQARATELKVDLRDACKAEGIASTTLMRWGKGEVFPREQTARALIERIEAMATPKSEDAA